MSTEFGIQAREKNRKDAPALTLFWLCTTPARQLDAELHFKYAAENEPLTAQMIDEIVDYYEGKIAEDKKYIADNEEQVAFETKILCSAEKEIVIEQCRDNIAMYKQSIVETKEDIESETRNLVLVDNIRDMMKTAEFWDFTYYFG
jgi:hypothetical protein